MAGIQTVEGQDDFSAGMNRDAAPHLISDTGAYDLVDVVLDDDGSAYRRGGTAARSVNAVSGWGTDIFDATLNVGRRTLAGSKQGTYVLDSDDETLIQVSATGVPSAKQHAVMNGIVFGGGGMVYGGARSGTVHTATGVVTVTNNSNTVTRFSGSWLGDVVPGHLMQIGGGRVYAVDEVQSATSLTLQEAWQGSTAGGQTAVFNPVLWGSGPVYGPESYVCVCANRLLYAAGRKIRFSKIGDPHTFDVNDYHELPSGALIVGLYELGGTAIVFTTDGIWTIDGLALNIVDANGNGQHTVRRLSSDIACAGITGVAGFAQQLVVPANDGIWLLDGVSSPTRISRGVERAYKAWLDWGARLGKAVVFQGHYLLPIIAPAGQVKDLLVCRINRPVKSRWNEKSWPWSQFQGDGRVAALTVRHGDTELSPSLLAIQGKDGGKIVDCTLFFNPAADSQTDADGTIPIPQIVTRDFGSGNTTINAVRAVGLRYELRGSGAVRVEWSAGGPNFDVAGQASKYRRWGDVDARWGDTNGLWGEGFGPLIPDTTTPASGPSWTELLNPPAESDGIARIKCRVNKRARYSRFRITCDGQVEGFRFRSIEIFSRPSQAVRR